MEVVISSPPDRNYLVAEIWFSDEQWAEVNQEEDELRVEIYPRQGGGPWSFPLTDALEALMKAASRLLVPYRPNPPT
jgi:hypothetical protein